jgi:hypothetical protein
MEFEINRKTSKLWADGSKTVSLCFIKNNKKHKILLKKSEPPYSLRGCVGIPSLAWWFNGGLLTPEVSEVPLRGGDALTSDEVKLIVEAAEKILQDPKQLEKEKTGLKRIAEGKKKTQVALKKQLVERNIGRFKKFVVQFTNHGISEEEVHEFVRMAFVEAVMKN